MAANKKCSQGKEKIFILDTNIILHDPECMSHTFGDNIVVIPMPVIDELDKFKTGMRTINRNARQAIRFLNSLNEEGKLSNGVSRNDTGGILKVVPLNKRDLLYDDPLLSNDTKILTIAKNITDEEQKKQNGKGVVLISHDINVRVRANCLGITNEDMEHGSVPEDQFYTGIRKIDSAELLQEVASGKEADLPSDLRLFPNEFIELDPNVFGRVNIQTKKIVPLTFARRTTYGIKGKNIEQKLALELLMRDNIQLVTMTGRAGTGKTLLALASALQKVQEEVYKKVLVYRPIIPVGNDVGYLPGDLDAKLNKWMMAIDDNLEFLDNINSGKTNKNGGVITPYSGIVEKDAMTYIRGRSIPSSFIIIDEAQNLTREEVKTIVTRVSESSKIVFIGDIEQIDNSHLDKGNNGLIYLIEKMKESGFSGHVNLKKSERGKLAEYAANVL